ncbi:hypothetical protein D3C86_2178700 [compost metagenome]
MNTCYRRHCCNPDEQNDIPIQPAHECGGQEAGQHGGNSEDANDKTDAQIPAGQLVLHVRGECGQQHLQIQK